MTQTQEISVTDVSSRAPGGVRELLAVALPMMVSHACDTAMTFTDRLFLAKLGPETMNAAMAGGLTCFTMMTLFIGLIGYSTALVAQYLGAGQRQRCALAATQAAILAVAAYPLILLARPLVLKGFAASGISAGQLAPQTEYFNILVYGTILGLLRTSLAGFFSGVGRTRVVMAGAMAATVVNIVMNYVLIYGKCGFPALGIRGAAYGTILGGAAFVAVLLGAYLRQDNRRQYHIGRAWRWDAAAMKTLVRFGYPAGIEMFLNLLAFTAIIMVFHAHGQVTATASTIMFNWDMVSFVPLLGVEIGVMSLVGRYMGAGRPDWAHRSAMSGLKIGWVFSAMILALFVFLPRTLVEVFRPEGPQALFDEAVPTALFMIRLASLYVMIEAVVVVFSGALRGAGDTFWAMCISVTLHWLLLPILAVMLHVLGCSAEAAWTALVVTFLLFSLAFYLRYRSGKWRSIRVVGGPTRSVEPGEQAFHEGAAL